MKNLLKTVSILLGTAMVFAFASCKADVEVVEVAKKYASQVVFTASATQNEGEVSVTMETATEGAVIYYTTDGTDPTLESTKYTAAILVTEDTTFKAIAVKEGVEPSPVSFAKISVVNKIETKIEIKEVEKIVEKDKVYASPVTFTPTATDDGVSLALATATEGAIIYYTTDGTAPTSESTEFTAAFEITKDTTVKAVAVKEEIENSPVSVATVTIKTITETVPATGNPLQIALIADVPHENGYTGTKSNTTVTVTANITTGSSVSRVVWKKNGSLVAKTLLADNSAAAAMEDSADNKKWTFTITATDETANGTYTVAVIDEAGREEAEQIEITQFDFTAPAKIKIGDTTYSDELKAIILNWTNPADADYDHVEITYTTNDGTSDSDLSEAEIVTSAKTTKTFQNIDDTKKYYTFYFVAVDALGNKAVASSKKVGVNQAVSNIPEGFVEVTGGTFDGTTTLTPSSSVFISGRTVTIGDLWVCDHEVTQKEYATYCKYGSSSPSSSYGVGDNYPAYYVNWYDAVVYCNLRSMAEGLTPAYAISGETDPTTWSGIVGDAETKYCGHLLQTTHGMV